jgi:hypothetical protein
MNAQHDDQRLGLTSVGGWAVLHGVHAVLSLPLNRPDLDAFFVPPMWDPQPDCLQYPTEVSTLINRRQYSAVLVLTREDGWYAAVKPRPFHDLAEFKSDPTPAVRVWIKPCPEADAVEQVFAAAEWFFRVAHTLDAEEMTDLAIWQSECEPRPWPRHHLDPRDMVGGSVYLKFRDAGPDARGELMWVKVGGLRHHEDKLFGWLASTPVICRDYRFGQPVVFHRDDAITFIHKSYRARL